MYLLTIRPGPVLHVWREGKELAAVPLTRGAALALFRNLAGAIR